MNQNEVSENNMYEATQCIVKKFDELDFKYEYEKYDDTDMLTLRFNTDTIPLVEIILVITEDFDCGIYSPNIANVNEEKMTEMLKALNELNAEYKYVRFYANDNTITVKTEVYPKIMETIWKTN